MWTEDQEKLWHGLHGRTCQLFVVWKLNRALYADEKRVKRMNSISGTGFAILQRCLIHEHIRIAMALTDKASQGTKQNLSIYRLVDTLEPALATNIRARLDETAEPLSLLRKHRNRRLMHFDLATAVKEEALPRLLGSDLDAVVLCIGTVMNEISLACRNSKHQGYENIIFENADGALQWMISDTIRYRWLLECGTDPDISDAQLREMVRDRRGIDHPCPQ